MTAKAGQRKTRSYRSPRREQQAAQTRQDVVEAAADVLAEDGWAGATVASIAERAGVSAETIYKGFGSKKNLLREAMDMAIVGDAEPVPLFDRPEFAALGEGDSAERFTRAAAMTADIHERSARIWSALLEAANADPEIAAWRRELEQGRRTDVGRGGEMILGERLDESLVTLLWVILGPETYLKLLDDAGYDRAAYEAFLIDAIKRLSP